MRVIASPEKMDARANFIRENPDKTLTELSHALKISYSATYNLCIVFDLPYRELRTKRRISEKALAGMFDETERENWLC